MINAPLDYVAARIRRTWPMAHVTAYAEGLRVDLLGVTIAVQEAAPPDEVGALTLTVTGPQGAAIPPGARDADLPRFDHDRDALPYWYPVGWEASSVHGVVGDDDPIEAVRALLHIVAEDAAAQARAWTGIADLRVLAQHPRQDDIDEAHRRALRRVDQARAQLDTDGWIEVWPLTFGKLSRPHDVASHLRVVTVGRDGVVTRGVSRDVQKQVRRAIKARRSAAV